MREKRNAVREKLLAGTINTVLGNYNLYANTDRKKTNCCR